MQAKDAMSTGLVSIPKQASLQEAAECMRRTGVGMLPVTAEDGSIIGTVTDRDITVRAIADGLVPDAIAVGEAMTPGVAACLEDDDIADVVRRMQQDSVRRMLVRNRKGRSVGIISLADIARCRLDRQPGVAMDRQPGTSSASGL